MTAKIRFVGVSIIQGQTALSVIVGKSDLIRNILITDKEAAELAIQIIRHLRDATATPPAIEQARREGALQVLRLVDDPANPPSARVRLDEIADQVLGGWPDGWEEETP